MQYSTLLLAALPFLAAPIVAELSCEGEVFDNYCCESGTFIGPVVSAFSSSMSSLDASLSSLDSSLAAAATSQEAAENSLEASLDSQFSNSGTRTGAGAAAMVTTPPKMMMGKRTITSEVSSGLTCVGSSVFSVDFSGGGAFVTQAPMLMGAAAAVAAYGAI
ncbi:hypothetical protein BDZ45DRAFT_805700 [Acephala macrosclerotiorum]|nr:hypothetical protein BDZ45DRAFT_805700 [Acephala macrosclerotiorum]